MYSKDAGSAADLLSTLAWVLDGLLAVDLDEAAALDLLRGSETARRRLSAVEHRGIAELTVQGTAAKHLARGTAALLHHELQIDLSDARRRVHAAQHCGPRRSPDGSPLPAHHPEVATAQRRGQISARHADLICSTLDDLPESVEAAVRHRAERELTEGARRLCPAQLAKVAATVAQRLDPDGSRSTDADRARRRGFTLGHQRPDGMSPVSGYLDPAARGLVEAALSALARPVAEDRELDPRTPRQRRHDALSALCRNSVASGTLPSNRGLPATVVVTMGWAELCAAAGTASTASGGELPVREVLTRAADAHWLLRVQGPKGQTLHLGQSHRLASSAQRLALYARDGGCTRPGCEMPAQWTQVHHLQEWQNGGPTDLDNLCLVCPYDHRLITDEGFTVRMGSTGQVEWIPPARLDPVQVPRVNPLHRARALVDLDAGPPDGAARAGFD